MKLDQTNLNVVVGNKTNENGVLKSSSDKQEHIISSSTSKTGHKNGCEKQKQSVFQGNTTSIVMKDMRHQEQTHCSETKIETSSNRKETKMYQQNGNVTNNNILKVHHATVESVGHEFHQASSIVQQTGYNGVSLFGGGKTLSTDQNNATSNGRDLETSDRIISCPMELPEVKSLSIKQPDLQNGNAAVPPTQKEENGIASAYFQNKYGSDNSENLTKKKAQPVSKQTLVNEIVSSIAMKKTNKAQSVGVQQERSRAITSRSKTATPERDSRASSVSSKGQGSTFSYLSLLPDDGTFPHRTHPIGDPQTSRRNSAQYGGTGGMSRSGSNEYLNQTGKKNFMVRSNPIGLAEPSVKRDGYAVGKDGSFYRSSEHLFENKTSQPSSRASSEAPDGNWRGNA